MAICKQSASSALFFWLVLTLSWETLGLATVAVNTISELVDGEVATSPVDPSPSARVFSFVIQKSSLNYDATRSGAAASFWAVLGTQQIPALPGSCPITFWLKSLTTGLGIAPESNASTIILLIQQTQIIIIMAESHNIQLYADILLYATIAVGTCIIIKWIMKKLFTSGWWGWSPSTKKLCPSDEIDCTTVAVQETRAHDDDGKARDLIEQ